MCRSFCFVLFGQFCFSSRSFDCPICIICLRKQVADILHFYLSIRYTLSCLFQKRIQIQNFFLEIQNFQSFFQSCKNILRDSEPFFEVMSNGSDLIPYSKGLSTCDSNLVMIGCCVICLFFCFLRNRPVHTFVNLIT